MRRLLESKGLSFYAIDLVLMPHPNKDGSWNNDGPELRIENFPCAEIYPEGLVQRVQTAHEELMAYYAAEDAKQKESAVG